MIHPLDMLLTVCGTSTFPIIHCAGTPTTDNPTHSMVYPTTSHQYEQSWASGVFCVVCGYVHLVCCEWYTVMGYCCAWVPCQSCALCVFMYMSSHEHTVSSQPGQSCALCVFFDMVSPVHFVCLHVPSQSCTLCVFH